MFVDTAKLPAVPWRNGGGVTREIAQCAGRDGFLWRLSIADVCAEGPFSVFAGMSRLLTMVEGDGLALSCPEAVFDVPYCEPVRFSGDTKVRSVLRQGKIRNFNVIFDPAVIDAQVTVLIGPTIKTFAPDVGALRAIFCVQGDFECEGEVGQQGAFVLMENRDQTISVKDQSRVLFIELTDITAG